MMPAYAPCFLAGVLAHSLATLARRTPGHRATTSLRPAPLPALAWPPALGVITLVYLFHPTLVVGWLCCLAVAMLLPAFKEIRFPPLVRASKVVARYSYGVYLSHFPCIWLAFVALRALPSTLRWMVFTATIVGIPVVLFHLIERPFIDLGARLSGKGLTT
jgi:peptidoglycan/LPS O-acetylase OafA/YrhL